MKFIVPLSLSVGLAVAAGASVQRTEVQFTPKATAIDEQGRAWVLASVAKGGESWYQIPGVDDAAAVAIDHDSVLIARTGGPAVVWDDGRTRVSPWEQLAEMRSVSCSTTHCLALTARGTVLSWGSNVHGELGRSWDQGGATPREIEGLQETKAVAAGEGFSAALSESGSVFLWGLNDDGQLRSIVESLVVEPRVVMSGVAEIAAGRGHAAALTLEGVVHTWGAGRSEQLELRGTKVRAVGDAIYVVDDEGGVHLFGAAPQAQTPPPADMDEIDRAVLTGETRARAEQSEAGLAIEETSISSGPTTAPIAAGTRAVMLTRFSALSVADTAFSRRLETLGFSVVPVAVDSLAESDIKGAGVVVLGQGARGRNATALLRQAKVPLVSLDRFALAGLGLIAGGPTSEGASRGRSVVVVDSKHALGAGGDGAYAALDRPALFPWAQPLPSAHVVGVVETGQASIFGFEPGSDLAGGIVAPARRGAFLLPRYSAAFTDQMWSLFDSSVCWTVGDGSESCARRLRKSVGRAPAGPQVPQGSTSLWGGSGTILLVVGNTTLSTRDDVYKTRMEGMGFTVTTKLASSSSSGDATGKVLVFVSSSCPNGDILTKFLNVTVPVVIQTSGIVDDMLMSGTTPGVDRDTEVNLTTALINLPNHAIAAPLSGTISVTNSADWQAWGLSSTNATRVVAVPSPSSMRAAYPWLA